MSGFLHHSVRFLTRATTLAALIGSTGCSMITRQFHDECNNHAYIARGLDEFISSRFPSGAPVRMAIVPFSVPANLSTRMPEVPGLDRQMAQRVHAHFLGREQLPIIEVFNRQDWPGKKEEFYSGNFGAIAAAREAGYDFVLVGSIEPIKDISVLSAAAKIIEVESGITLFYGKSSVQSYGEQDRNFWAHFGWATRRPDKLFDSGLIDKLSHCIVNNASMADQPH